MSPNQTMTNRQVTVGMDVFGSDGEKLGTVRHYDLRTGYLDIQKGRIFHKDFYVPFGRVAQVDEDAVTLGLTKEDLDNEAYGMPPLARAAMYDKDSLTITPSLPEEKLPFDVERETITVAHRGTSLPIH